MSEQPKQQQKNVRDSAIELLRIISMIMIIFYHFAFHGGFEWAAKDLSVTRFWYNLMMMGGKIGVDVFVLITGYYLIKSEKSSISWQKVIKFVGQVLFYSLALYLIFWLTGEEEFRLKDFFKAFFPLTFKRWWFASTYFVLYLLHPFINKFLKAIDRSLYQKLIIVLVVCWSIIPTFTGTYYQGNQLLWFITLYAVSAYARLYGFNPKFTHRTWCVFLLVSALFMYATSVVLTLLGTKWSVLSSGATYFYGREKITTFIVSLCIFMVFATMKTGYCKWINLSASTTFGVYLIHDHIFMRGFLWVTTFKNATFQNSLWLIPWSIMAIVLVYVVCSLIELVRLYALEKPLMKCIERYSSGKESEREKRGNGLKDFIFGKEESEEQTVDGGQ